MAIKSKMIKQEVEVTESLSCDNCEENIPLVFDDPRGTTQQGDNALKIIFGGGYGMYVDPLVSPNLSMLWCEKCANMLADKFPSIEKLIGHGYKSKT